MIIICILPLCLFWLSVFSELAPKYRMYPPPFLISPLKKNSTHSIMGAYQTHIHTRTGFLHHACLCQPIAPIPANTVINPIDVSSTAAPWRKLMDRNDGDGIIDGPR